MAGTTISDHIDAYLKDRKARGDISRDTARNQRCALYSFAEVAGNRKLKNLGPVHIETWLASHGHLAPATRRARLSTLRQFFAWCVRRGYCRRNPAAEVRAPKQPRTIPRGLDRHAIAKVFAQCPDERAVLIVTLMVQQGLRCCEVSRLELGDLDRTNHTMRIVGKGGHERILPILEETLDAINDYLHAFPASAGPLVRSYRQPHRPLTADVISGLVGSWMWAAGIKRARRDGISAHATRHTCATDMLRRGAHLRDVQAALGHKHLQTTEVYLPHLVRGLADAMTGRSYRSILASGSPPGANA